MHAYVIRRLGQSVFVLIAIALLVFVAIYAIGDPVSTLAPQDATTAELEGVRQRLGLDRPIYVQFFLFLSNAAQGDLGRSFVYGEPALKLVLERFPATLELALLAAFLAVTIGVPLGVYAGLRPDSLGGRGIMVGSIFGFSLPSFWQGLMLILIFAIVLRWVPAGGRGDPGMLLGLQSALFSLDGLRHLLLPAVNLSLFKVALLIRVARAATREVALQDYIVFARAKGLSRTRIVWVHILKNIMIPVITVLGLELGSLIAFAIVTETVFAYPGMGKLLIDSISQLDRPVIVAYLMVTVVVFVLINLLADLAYAAIDPRVRLAGGGKSA
ncbi:ABC transporter permease [Aquamicrobium sp. LC103]|uniref:ABC transporter permease n=1 Tax=Aquamicrobium sp. LC103 TaxID=1120658 RepID=UPI00063EC98C|nr:ABC transporter permease [Aquamicrobium sp. LC103]TKT69896.1 ABC transporter permease [Aquamicrobium sp. LC103]